MHRRMRRFMAEHFLEQRSDGGIEEPGREGDLSSRRTIVPERSPHPTAHAHADALPEIRNAPEPRPLVEERLQGLELTGIEFGHVFPD